MKLRSSSIVTVIVTAIVTMAASIVTPASAEILTVCANSPQSAAPELLPSRRLADAIIPLGGRADLESDALIALWRDDGGFDILVNWGESDQHSLRADGAQIIGAAPSAELVHLMVAHGDGGLEHFLFRLDENGSGRLLRSLAADVPGAPASGSVNAVCARPH